MSKQLFPSTAPLPKWQLQQGSLQDQGTILLNSLTFFSFAVSRTDFYSLAKRNFFSKNLICLYDACVQSFRAKIFAFPKVISPVESGVKRDEKLHSNAIGNSLTMLWKSFREVFKFQNRSLCMYCFYHEIQWMYIFYFYFVSGNIESLGKTKLFPSRADIKCNIL